MKTITKNNNNEIDIESKDYVDFIFSMDNVFRVFLNLLKKDFIKFKITDINCVQGLIIYNLGYERMNVTELISRGCYIGSNISYNLKKLIDLGYIDQRQSNADKRLTIVKLTNSGLKLLQSLEQIISSHIKKINKQIKNTNYKSLKEKTKKIAKALENLSKR